MKRELRLSEDDNIELVGDRSKRDPCLDALLDLDGQILVVDQKGEHWVEFDVKEVPVTQERPHGLRYSLTLHGKNNERLVGFDNAHQVRRAAGPGGRGSVLSSATFDHKHRFRTVRPYEYREAAALLADFWSEVDAVPEERGVLK
jgi:hypothetical protein